MCPITYRKRMKVEDDRSQSKFTNTGQAKVKQKPKITMESRFSMTEQFACPFCLGLYKLQQYLISTKHGIHQGLAQCPECKNKCRFTTLTGRMTPEEYAEYIHNQVKSGIWQKMPFNKWKERLYKIGWAQKFWKRYNELKAESKESDALSEFEKEQLAWAEEAGYIK